MPSGRTHDRITLWSLPWVVGSTFLLTRNGELTLIVAGAFLFSGLMFGPDLDVYSVQFKRWGWLRGIWLPYQKILRHRSVLSHGVIIGTTLRLLYLFCLVLILGIVSVGIAQLVAGFPWNWHHYAQKVVRVLSFEYRGEAIAFFVGLELGAMSHSFSDWTGSTYKRIQNKKKKKRRLPFSSQRRKRN